MRVSSLLALATGLTAAWVLPTEKGCAATLTGSRPNIIFILTDDQGYGQLGCQGHPWLKTPHIDALRHEGMAFDDFQVSPTCSPTRAALMTGNVPFKNAVSTTNGPRSCMVLSAVTLPQLLKQAGYTTGIFGKWHLGDEEPYQPTARGFDEAFVHGSGGVGQPQDVPGNKYFDPVIRHNGSFVKTKGFCTDVFFAEALRWIEKNKDKPFFAYLSTNAPHSPYIAPEKNAQRFRAMGLNENGAGFYGMIENIDENVGRLMQRLREWDLDDNTLVVFMSDNGFASVAAVQGKVGKDGNTPIFAYQAGLKGHKKTPHEGGTRVPAMFRWKGKINEDTTCNALTTHIDFLPTLLELAGSNVPHEIDGKSMVPLLENPNADWPDRTLCFHIGRWSDKVGPDDSKYDTKTGFAVRNARYRWVNGEELYDVLADRGENKNLLEEHPDIGSRLKIAYDQWWDIVRPFLVHEKAGSFGPNPFHEVYEKQKASSGIPEWKKPAFADFSDSTP
jgi:arylsulfatase A-like enzyme